MTTVTAMTADESRAAIESLKVGDTLRFPGVCGFTYRVTERIVKPFTGNVGLRIHAEGARLPGSLWPRVHDDRGGFQLTPTVEEPLQRIHGFEIVA